MQFIIDCILVRAEAILKDQDLLVYSASYSAPCSHNLFLFNYVRIKIYICKRGNN